jgi:hypothetical protein
VLRRGAALFAGCATAVGIAMVAVLIVRQIWPAYAIAEPTKHYSLAMLIARLTVGALSTVGAAIIATRVARDDGAIAWRLGGLFLAVSLPDHLVLVWPDYPGWYHIVYLSYLVPIAGYTGRAVSRYWGKARSGRTV